MRTVAIFCSIALFVFPVTLFAGEKKLTTYYPAPYGQYKTLQTTGDTYLATTSGNVGIGTSSAATKLDVAGGIKVGSDSSACDSSKAGTMRYNAGAMQYCNGSAWVGMGAGAGAITCNWVGWAKVYGEGAGCDDDPYFNCQGGFVTGMSWASNPCR